MAMKKIEVVDVFLSIVLQLILLPLSLFFIFGFTVSFEYPFPNMGHLIYFCLLVGSLWLFILLSTSFPGHKKISYFIATTVCVCFIYVVFCPWICPWIKSVYQYLNSKYTLLVEIFRDFQFQIGKLIAKIIGE